MNVSELKQYRLPVVVGRLQDFPDDPIDCLSNLHKEYGTLVALQEGDQHLVFVFGAENNRHVLTRSDVFHSRFFAMRGPRNSSQRRLTCGLLSMNGDVHAQQRRVVKSAFEKRALPGYVEYIIAQTLELLVDWAPRQLRDISGEMTRLMLGISSSMLFGMDRPELAIETGEMMETWVRLNHELGANAFQTSDEFFPRYEQLLQLAEDIEVRIREIISRRTRQAGTGCDIVSLLLRGRQAGQAISDDELIGQTALIFAASHMTTAHTLTWMLFLLAQHPEVMSDLRSEISTATPGDVCNGLSGDMTSVLERVIRESMRLMPASTYSQRVAQDDVDVKGGTIPAGSLVIFSPYIAHRNEAVYSNSATFNPDRWLTLKPDTYDYIPFGGGSRLCPGAPLAAAIIRTAVPMIISQTGLSAIAGSRIDARVRSTMCSPDRGLPILLTEPDTISPTVAVRGNINSLVQFPAEDACRRVA